MALTTDENGELINITSFQYRISELTDRIQALKKEKDFWMLRSNVDILDYARFIWFYNKRIQILRQKLRDQIANSIDADSSVRIWYLTAFEELGQE